MTTVHDIVPTAHTLTILETAGSTEVFGHPHEPRDVSAVDVAGYGAALIAVTPDAHPVVPRLSRVLLYVTTPSNERWYARAWVADADAPSI